MVRMAKLVLKKKNPKTNVAYSAGTTILEAKFSEF